MTANYHTHTPLCRHANGTPEEYALAAIGMGLKVLGFSDHIPSDFPGGYVSNYRMFTAQTEGYVKSIASLREKFKGKLDIYIGYECEYYPEIFGSVISNVLKYECDYLILGQHFTKSEYNGFYAGCPTNDESILKQYVDQVVAALKTGKFSYVAHPDLINFTGNRAVYKSEMKRLCDAAKFFDTPLEFNLLGFSQKRNYPCREFFEIAAQTGNSVIQGIDAHSPSHFSKETALSAEKYLSDLGITPIKDLKLRSVK